ncbi:hypothetical protein LQ948_10525 [Jiella sp. MQZ9-1]|uniref:Uncharacterized protein n=1 Tax=Jiella flava TaxID=2816857 RepID=A0A939JVG0_9HYPH|nr:hypothetical protein [Jiella flava]MBO0662419.1 hypothetical protein [Jiella flava]MCD2471643.1 hypothetical protein [Jiella flava]
MSILRTFAAAAVARTVAAVGDRFIVLNRDTILGAATRGDIIGNKRRDMLAEGRGMAELKGSLGGTV